MNFRGGSYFNIKSLGDIAPNLYTGIIVKDLERQNAKIGVLIPNTTALQKQFIL